VIIENAEEFYLLLKSSLAQTNSSLCSAISTSKVYF